MYEMENKIHVPNHQPVSIVNEAYKATSKRHPSRVLTLPEDHSLVFLPAGMALSEIGRSLVLGDFEVLTG